MPDRRDRYRGALLGLAAGDAVGTTLEFISPGSFEPIEDMVGGGPFDLEPGQRTDDTSMVLCLAASSLEHSTARTGSRDDGPISWLGEKKSSSWPMRFCQEGVNRALNRAVLRIDNSPCRDPLPRTARGSKLTSERRKTSCKGGK